MADHAVKVNIKRNDVVGSTLNHTHFKAYKTSQTAAVMTELKVCHSFFPNCIHSLFAYLVHSYCFG